MSASLDELYRCALGDWDQDLEAQRRPSERTKKTADQIIDRIVPLLLTHLRTGTLGWT